MLAASVDDEQSEQELRDIKAKVKEIFRRLSRNSEPQASIESGPYTLQYACTTTSHGPGTPVTHC